MLAPPGGLVPLVREILDPPLIIEFSIDLHGRPKLESSGTAKRTYVVSTYSMVSLHD